MSKNKINIIITDLLEQIERIDIVMAAHRGEHNEKLRDMSLRQYGIRRQEFIDQLNEIFQKYNLTVAHKQPFIHEHKPYIIQEEGALEMMSMVAESKVEIGKK